MSLSQQVFDVNHSANKYLMYSKQFYWIWFDKSQKTIETLPPVVEWAILTHKTESSSSQRIVFCVLNTEIDDLLIWPL